VFKYPIVVATTHWNGTCNMLTSAKLSIDYLVVGITRELNKKPSLHCFFIYINTTWSVLQQYLSALMSMHRPHILLLIYYKATVTNFIQLVSPQPVDRFSQTKLRWKSPNEGYSHICGMYKSNNKQLRYQAISSCKSFVC